MKQFFFVVLALVMFSCSGNRKQAETTVTVFDVESLLAVAEQEVNDTITVAGFVTHTCKHSGKKCFIVGESQDVSLQVFAGGEIEAFNAELVGSKLAITGVLKEDRQSSEEIDEMEKMVKMLQEKGTQVEACATELSNISNMRQWMKDHGKDYYITYYVEGLKYEVLEQE
jgi:3-methyladenine DNA glycosylase Tag